MHVLCKDIWNVYNTKGNIYQVEGTNESNMIKIYISTDIHATPVSNLWLNTANKHSHHFFSRERALNFLTQFPQSSLWCSTFQARLTFSLDFSGVCARLATLIQNLPGASKLREKRIITLNMMYKIFKV